MNRILLIIEDSYVEFVKERIDDWISNFFNKYLIKDLSFKILFQNGSVFVLSNDFSNNNFVFDVLLHLREFKGLGKKLKFELFFIRDKEIDKQTANSKSLEDFYLQDSKSANTAREILFDWFEEEFIGINIESLIIIKYNIEKAFSIYENNKSIKEKKENSKGFKITIILTVIISLINLYINYYYYLQHYITSTWISVGIIMITITFYQKILKENIKYAFLLLIMLLYFTIPYALAHETTYFWITDKDNYINIIPFLSLFFQRPLRLIFFKINGYEPVLERGSNLSNSLYSILFIMIPIITASILFSY